ncbi:MAG: hypothetical protein ACLUOI_19585 [Eisenbergiella sp.]
METEGAMEPSLNNETEETQAARNVGRGNNAGGAGRTAETVRTAIRTVLQEESVLNSKLIKPLTKPSQPQMPDERLEEQRRRAEAAERAAREQKAREKKRTQRAARS